METGWIPVIFARSLDVMSSEITLEITWIREDAKASLERERSENGSLEASVKALRRALDEREGKISDLKDRIRNTEDRASACRWWLGFLILESALVTYFAEPLSRLPIPLWGVHAGALIGWIGFWVFLRKKLEK